MIFITLFIAWRKSQIFVYFFIQINLFNILIYFSFYYFIHRYYFTYAMNLLSGCLCNMFGLHSIGLPCHTAAAIQLYTVICIQNFVLHFCKYCVAYLDYANAHGFSNALNAVEQLALVFNLLVRRPCNSPISIYIFKHFSKTNTCLLSSFSFPSSSFFLL